MDEKDTKAFEDKLKALILPAFGVGTISYLELCQKAIADLQVRVENLESRLNKE